MTTPAIEVETLDAKSAETLRQIQVLLVGARLTCDSDLSSMIAALVGAAILAARETIDPLHVLATVIISLADVRERLIANRKTGGAS